MSSLSDKEGMESLKKNEEKLTHKFNTCITLLKDIEYVVKSNTSAWKNIYEQQKPSDYVLQVDERDAEEQLLVYLKLLHLMDYH